ncbi:hypothetical protein GCM10023170_044380 [Phytohabitans houttuyneae]
MVIRKPVGHVGLDKREAGVLGQVGHVVLGPGHEVVDGHHRAPARQQRVNEVRRDKSRTPGDEDAVTCSESRDYDHERKPTD